MLCSKLKNTNTTLTNKPTCLQPNYKKHVKVVKQTIEQERVSIAKTAAHYRHHLHYHILDAAKSYLATLGSVPTPAVPTKVFYDLTECASMYSSTVNIPHHHLVLGN